MCLFYGANDETSEIKRKRGLTTSRGKPEQQFTIITVLCETKQVNKRKPVLICPQSSLPCHLCGHISGSFLVEVEVPVGALLMLLWYP